MWFYTTIILPNIPLSESGHLKLCILVSFQVVKLRSVRYYRILRKHLHVSLCQFPHPPKFNNLQVLQILTIRFSWNSVWSVWQSRILHFRNFYCPVTNKTNMNGRTELWAANHTKSLEIKLPGNKNANFLKKNRLVTWT